ncbi:MAG: hypothetical protein ABI947_02885 [Chloroflexota bacterium]
MNIWMLRADHVNYKNIKPVREADSQYFDWRSGYEYRQKWIPFSIKFYDPEAETEGIESKKLIGDMEVNLSINLVCNSRAM